MRGAGWRIGGAWRTRVRASRPAAALAHGTAGCASVSCERCRGTSPLPAASRCQRRAAPEEEVQLEVADVEAQLARRGRQRVRLRRGARRARRLDVQAVAAAHGCSVTALGPCRSPWQLLGPHSPVPAFGAGAQITRHLWALEGHPRDLSGFYVLMPLVWSIV